MKHVKRFNTVGEAMETAANGLPSPHLSYIESTEKVCFASTNSSTLQCGFDENGISAAIPENNTTDEIWYISYDGNIVTPYATTGFTQSIVSNTYTNGLGVIKFNAPLTKIGNYAFYGKTNLKLISFPTGVTAIGDCALKESGIQALKIPNGVQVLPLGLCLGCNQLKTVSIPSSVTGTSYQQQFESCNDLRYLEINDGLTTLTGRFVNQKNPKLEKFVLPTSITSIESIAWAFSTYDAIPLDCFYYKGTVAQWNSINIDTYDLGMNKTFTIHCSDGNTTVSVVSGAGGWDE